IDLHLVLIIDLQLISKIHLCLSPVIYPELNSIIHLNVIPWVSYVFSIKKTNMFFYV
ncbi:unnamed protein product, partial [Adineta steineri]